MLDDDMSFQRADIFIEPPPVDSLTDEDSEEEDGEGGIHNLNGRQLAMSASATVSYPDGKQRVGDEASPEENTVADEEGSSSELSLSEEEPVPSTSTTRERPNRPKKRSSPQAHSQTPAKRKRSAKTPPPNRDWRKADLSGKQTSRFPWNSPPVDTSRLPQNPVEMFELFYDDEVIGLIRKQSEVYAAFTGNHTFKVSKDEIRTFLAILLISGYSTVPRRRMYWSNDPDVRNAAIAGSMTRDRFDEIMKYCHVRDNNYLEAGEK